MKNLFFVILTSTFLLFGCSKDYLEKDDPAENEVALNEVDDLSLRSGLETHGGFKSMDEMREALSTALPNFNDKISAAWTLNDHLGLIYGNQYTIINMRSAQKVAQGSLKDAGDFWNNAPVVWDIHGAHHPTDKDNGITAGWIYGDLIGFTSKNAYWNSLMSSFHKPDVWKLPFSKSGELRDVPFWNKPELGLPPKDGITAGFMSPFNSFVAFSKDKIFVYSNNANKWVVGKRINELQPGEPFYFLKSAPKSHLLTEINAAFYNAGSNEFVFMNNQTWWAYKYNGKNAGTWTSGTLRK